MIFKPPQRITNYDGKTSIFLAGTIDNGNPNLDDWQTEFVNDVEQHSPNIYDFYNPRRENWDSELVTQFENPVFYQQVTWEISAMSKADIIVMYFLPDSISPITLLELGLFAESKKLIVCCPKEYWRSGNVQIVCDMFNVPLYEDINQIIELFKLRTILQFFNR